MAGKRLGAVCVGGTFDRMHRAHRVLLSRAAEVGRKVFVGISSDRMASERRRGARLEPYRARSRSVRRFLEGLGRPFEIQELNDPFGPAAFGPFDGLVVSADTRPTAERLNLSRRTKRLPLLKIVEVELVPAEDGLPLSSSRIRSGEIDREGRLRAVRVRLGSTNPVKLRAVQRVFSRLHAGRPVKVEPVRVRSGVPDEPFGEQVINGALNRAQNALQGSSAHFGVGIEAGLFRSEHLDGFFDVQFCAVVDRGGRMTLGHGPGFQCPPAALVHVKRGMSVGAAMGHITGVREIGRKQGVIGLLSRGLMDRSRLSETAVISALLPRLNPELYSLA